MVLISACWILDGHVTGSTLEPDTQTVIEDGGAYRCPGEQG